jgi:hypothetical protein
MLGLPSPAKAYNEISLTDGEILGDDLETKSILTKY